MTVISSHIPASYSNKDWRKLGDRIRSNPANICEQDLNMLQDLRLTYKQPLAIVFQHLEKIAHKVDKHCICTYRVKRIDSIISKTIRLPEMSINRAEDIAGCRCIVHSLPQVYQVFEKFKKSVGNVALEIKSGGHDYIKEPKQGGYKSLHVIVALQGDNRRIEIQIRTIEQHNWATLVEISDLLFDAKIKEYGNKHNPDLYLFHELLSKSEEELSESEKYKISEIALQYCYIDRVGTIFQNNYIDVRKCWNSSKVQRKHFFLISTDSSGVPEFEGFSYFEEAEAAYFNRYLNNKENKNIVLTHLEQTSFDKISMAYSNYMLTYNAIILRILILLSEAIINAYRKNQIFRFKKLYKYFLDVIFLWIENQAMDINSFGRYSHARKSVIFKTEWYNSIRLNYQSLSTVFNNVHAGLKFRITNIIPYIIKNKILKTFIGRCKTNQPAEGAG